MTEAIAILRGLFADGPFSYAGRYYTITDMDGQPKPVQRPHPPFLIGGTRERVLRLAAREADIVGLDLRQRGDGDPGRLRGANRRPSRLDPRRGRRSVSGELDINVLRLLGDITVTDEPLKAAAEVARRLTGWTGVTSAHRTCSSRRTR